MVLMGGAQAMLARRYWIAEKQEVLQNYAQSMAEFVSDNAHKGVSGNYYVSESLEPTLTRFAAALEGSVLIVDNQYQLVLCSHTDCTHRGEVLPPLVQRGLNQPNFFTVSRLGGLFEQNQYVAAARLAAHDGTPMGYVLTCSSSAALWDYVLDNLQTYLIAGAAVLTVAFIALYILTYRLVRPLRQMAAITRQFSRGDFSGRVTVRGQDEVAELANALNGMAVSLSSVEDMRRSFVANVSHELKTPMTTIGGFIDGILDGTVPEDKRTDYLRIVSEETKRLSRVVVAMLNLSRIDSGQLKLNPVSFDLTAMVCATLLSFEQRINQKRLNIEGLDDCGPHTVQGDYDLLQQVVYNLLDNAVKFTNEGGTITLTVARADDRTVCVVRNTGEGIPAVEMPHIFERFYKSDRSRGVDKNGTGLGLYIVKSVVNLHGGEITVRSAEGEYCEFMFWLPDTEKNAPHLQKK